MLALLGVDGARLNAGSVGLALARCWSDSGEGVLFVDADQSGSRLADRLGAAEHAEYSPAARGLPTLMVARRPLTLASVAPHCYSVAGGALWTLFAPFHPKGGEVAAAWLAARAGELEALDRERTVVLASSIRPGRTVLEPLLRAAPLVILLAPVPTAAHAAALWQLLRDAGLMGFERSQRALIVVGDSRLDDQEIRAETGVHVAGRLPAVSDERVLRLPSGARRDRSFVRSLDAIAARLWALSALGASEAEAAIAALATPARPGRDGAPEETFGDSSKLPRLAERTPSALSERGD